MDPELQAKLDKMTLQDLAPPEKPQPGVVAPLTKAQVEQAIPMILDRQVEHMGRAGVAAACGIKIFQVKDIQEAMDKRRAELSVAEPDPIEGMGL